jgi:hypothetical protein
VLKISRKLSSLYRDIDTRFSILFFKFNPNFTCIREAESHRILIRICQDIGFKDFIFYQQTKSQKLKKFPFSIEAVENATDFCLILSLWNLVQYRYAFLAYKTLLGSLLIAATIVQVVLKG